MKRALGLAAATVIAVPVIAISSASPADAGEMHGSCAVYEVGHQFVQAHNGHWDTVEFIREYNQSAMGQNVHYHIFRNLTHEETHQQLCYVD